MTNKVTVSQGKEKVMENVVVSVFSVESEAFQAFTELRQAPAGEGYVVLEAALLKNKDGVTSMQDCFGARPADAAQTTGIMIGSLVGLLGGPIGVLLGASYGAVVGGTVDAATALDNLSAVEILAGKIFEGETVIVALVQEEEPAFDAAFEKYQTTSIRYDAVDIVDDVDRAYELQAEVSNQVLQELRAERKEERAARREERRADLKAKFEEYEAATNRSMGFE